LKVWIFQSFFFQRLDPDDETRCLMCPNGTLPDPDHLECVSLPEEYLNLESPLAIGAMAFALVGIVITSAVLGVYMRYNHTPVVRASGRELSYVLLVTKFSILYLKVFRNCKVMTLWAKIILNFRVNMLKFRTTILNFRIMLEMHSIKFRSKPILWA